MIALEYINNNCLVYCLYNGQEIRIHLSIINIQMETTKLDFVNAVYNYCDYLTNSQIF